MTSREQIADLAAPGASQAGLVVDSVEVTQRGATTVVTVVVDLPDDQTGSATIDTVAQASRAISAALDEAGVPAGAHTLEVTTPGIDRPLTTPSHFKRARTRTVEITRVSEATITGRVVEADDAGVTLDIDGETVVVDWAEVERGQIVVEFTRTER